MKIAIIGATRGIGLALTKAALEDGHDVAVLVRDPSRMPVDHPRLRLIVGDANDAEALAKAAAEGEDAVCDCLGTKKVFQQTSMFSRAAENLSRVLRPDQLFVAVTGIGAGDSKGHGGFVYDRLFMPLVLRRMYADKDRQEAIIKRKIARWIIVRPGFLNDGPRTGRYRALTDLTGIRGGPISRADVADFILAQVKSPQFIGQTPLLIN